MGSEAGLTMGYRAPRSISRSGLQITTSVALKDMVRSGESKE